MEAFNLGNANVKLMAQYKFKSGLYFVGGLNDALSKNEVNSTSSNLSCVAPRKDEISGFPNEYKAARADCGFPGSARNAISRPL